VEPLTFHYELIIQFLFIFILKLFFGRLRSFGAKLNDNLFNFFFLMTRLEEGLSMWERRRKWWWAQNSREKFNLVLPLCKLYPCDPLLFLKFNFDTKVYFYYFTVPGLREEREISLDFDMKVIVQAIFNHQNGCS